MNSPLRLDSSIYDHVDVEALQEHDPDSGDSALPQEIDVALLPGVSGADSWGVCLTLGIDAPEDGPVPPYRVDVTAYGYFTIDAGAFGEEGVDISRVVGVNGSSMLYSGLREFLYMVTSRGPWGPMTLSTVNFRDIAFTLLDSTEEDEEEEEEAEPESKPE